MLTEPSIQVILNTSAQDCNVSVNDMLGNLQGPSPIGSTKYKAERARKIACLRFQAHGHSTPEIVRFLRPLWACYRLHSAQAGLR